MNNSYKLLALDIDGTLTNSQKVIPNSTKEAIIDLQKRGVKIVLASGRSEYGLIHLAEELELSRYGGYVMSFNGGRITECLSGRIVYDRPLSLSEAADVYDTAVECCAGILGYEKGSLISGNGIDEYQIQDALACRMELKEVDNFKVYFSKPFNKCLLTGKPEHIKDVFGVVKKRFGDRLSITMSEKCFIVIMPKGVHKGAAIESLVKMLGMDCNDIVCCGDGMNDLTMIEYAGLGVAMANANHQLIESADYVTLSNDEEGILRVIEKFF